ncbi:MAG: glycosyltransferase family 1 protein [Terracidiphilus sp.]
MNLLYLQPKRLGGTETYAKELLKQFAKIPNPFEFVLFLNRDSYEELQVPEGKFFKILVPIEKGNPLKRVAVEQTVFPRLVRKHNIDVLHSMGYVCPLLVTVPQVITVHDMLYKRHPEFLPGAKLAFWRIFVPFSARRAKKVIAVSESTRLDVLEFLHLPPEKVVTIYSGISRMAKATETQIMAVRQYYGLTGEYLLTVGCGKHKRVDLIEESLQGVSGVQLVVTGLPESGAIPANSPARVRYLGFVNSEDIPALYAGAKAYITASEMEGFGFTVLEAMMADTPVICSTAGSLPEVCGDAAEIVAEQNSSAYARAIGRVCFGQELREEMIARGKMRVGNFPWRASAEKHLKLYADLSGKFLPVL